MFLYTKFHANRTIFGEVITFQDGGRRGHATSLFAILDHTRSRRGVPNLLFKFAFGILITFGYITILVFCHFAFKMPNHAYFLVNFRGSYPKNLTLIILIPKRHILGWKRVVWAINRENPSRGACPRNQKVKTGQQKRHNSVILTYVGRNPANGTATKFGIGVDVQDIITHAKF